MSHPLHANYFADQAVHETVELQQNLQLAQDTYRIRIGCAEIAERIVPGQFVMLRLTGCDDPLIGRPLALYDTVDKVPGTPEAIDLVYLVKGKLTSRLAQMQPGQLLDVWGPLGNGFQPAAGRHLVMVAGGIGYTPFLALAKEHLGHRRYGSPQRIPMLANRVTLCYGARTASLLAGLPEFEQIGVDVHVATDDGSLGYHGMVTELLPDLLSTPADTRVVCCGPEAMMAAVTRIARAKEVPCRVSLETPMACGIGICFTCVAKIRDESGAWDYKRTCVDGPVFDARDWVPDG